MAKRAAKKSKSADNLVEIRVPQRVIDEGAKLDADTLKSVVAAILGDYPLFGITRVDLRAHGSDSADPPDKTIVTKC